MRSYRIRHIRTADDPYTWRYDVIAPSLELAEVDDVIDSFADLDAARRYIRDVQKRQADSGATR